MCCRGSKPIGRINKPIIIKLSITEKEEKNRFVHNKNTNTTNIYIKNEINKTAFERKKKILMLYRTQQINEKRNKPTPSRNEFKDRSPTLEYQSGIVLVELAVDADFLMIC